MSNERSKRQESSASGRRRVRVEFLDEPQSAITRPLDMVNGTAYACTVFPVRRTFHDKVAEDGQIITLDQPKIKTTPQFYIVRGDGRVFGRYGDEPQTAVGLEVKIEDFPTEKKLWRGSAVQKYRDSVRPSIRKLFTKIAGVFNHFMDFRSSLTNQESMAEFSALAVLMTWLTPAFTVIPYFWPTGERGSGKTTWGTIWAMLSYLGEIVLSSSTFASIRDLADCGAALLFDDAEALSNPSGGDKRIRELLLAGNRVGATILVKTRTKNGQHVRAINAFTPRAFTAIRTPDPILLSRSIPIPLARTDDPEKTDVDPGDLSNWPCDPQRLVDQLWAAALMLLPEAKETWGQVKSEPGTTGREFELWRAIFVVARLLEERGVHGLEDRMRAVMMSSQREKHEIFGQDPTTLIIRALVQLAGISDASDTSDVFGSLVTSATRVCNTAKELAEDDDTQDVQRMNSYTVGRILSRLRLQKVREPNKNRDRRWRIAKRDLIRMARAHGVVLPGMNEEGEGSKS